MDIIHLSLSLSPVPYLAPAFSALRLICSSVQQAKASQRQLEALAQTIAQLLSTLNTEYCAGNLLQDKTSIPLANLGRLLDEISAFIEKETTCAFLKLIFTKGERISRIDEYHRQITSTVTSFQISASLNIASWQARNDDARAADHRELNQRLVDLEANQQQLKDTLNATHRNMMAMMVSLQKRLQTGSDEDRERQFFTHTLRCLTTCSGRQVELEDWSVTSYEVEFGHEIGSGGFGTVYKGSWNKTVVALKTLLTENGVTPSCKSIQKEIKTWSKIRHPNILQFLGANILDDTPFIVMPYMKNGNARDYLQEHPDDNRLEILCGISLGLVYLHSHRIVHGDLKALNVLIDDSGKAVLCDFGLSRIKSDATSRTAKPDAESIVGSRNWMAPERLMGGSLKMPCDIYAFGMTLYEIFADDIPLGHLTYTDFIELVVRQDVRPDRPDEEDAPQLADSIWELAETCWLKDPKCRPTASTVYDILSHLPGAISFSRSSPRPSSYKITRNSPPSSQTNLPRLGHASAVYCATFSADGKYIASGSSDHTIRVWEAQTGNPSLTPLSMHRGVIFCVAFSNNSSLIASGSADKTILVWNVLTGKIVAGPLQGHADYISSVVFSPDDKKIASASRDKTIRVWDVQTGHLLIGPLEGHTNSVTSVAFSGEGTRIASGSKDMTVRVWDAQASGPIQSPLRGHSKRVYFVAFSLDGKTIVSASIGGEVCVWNSKMGTLLFGPSQQHAEGMLVLRYIPNNTYCAVSPDGKWIAGFIPNIHGPFQVWDSQSGNLAASIQVHTGPVQSVTFSPDSKRILSASLDKTAYIHTIDW